MLLASRKAREAAVSRQQSTREWVRFGSAVKLQASNRPDSEPVLPRLTQSSDSVPGYSQNDSETRSISTAPFTTFLAPFSPMRKKMVNTILTHKC